MTRRTIAAVGSALAAMNEVGLVLTDRANRLERAGLADLAADLRELAEWLFAEAEGVTK